ncbi:MAG: helix-turn-helix transcriptional regulator [Legionella sp.]|nr:helix-turn-helix transcriptional regulator [Legionella sp.]
MYTNTGRKIEFGEYTAMREYKKPAASLKKLRHEYGLTQVEFSNILGINQPNLSAIESGRRGIGKALAKRVGERFKIDYRLLLEEKP